MSKLKINEVRYDVFGNCLVLENGLIELTVALDYGPRILRFSLRGKENMFYNDYEKKPLGDELEIYGGERSILYGGHRIWLSPEILPRCYHPDNLAVTVEKHENGLILKGAVEKHTGIQKIMDIAVTEDAPEIKIDHTIVNHGLWEIELGVWCITMLEKGGKAIIPMPDTKTGLLHNRNISLWDYSDMSDSRVYWGKNYITLTQNPKISQPFKLGLNNEAGWGAYFNKGQVFLKFFEPELNAVFPDNGCCYESYTNDFMLESETLSGIDLLGPGDSISHAEDWEIYEAKDVPGRDENEIKEIMAKYL